MDKKIQREIDSLIAELQTKGDTLNDPVSKLMAVTLLHQARKIKEEIEALPQRITEHLCSTFIPKNKVGAVPALALVQPTLKAKRETSPHAIIDGGVFTFKVDPKQSLSYYPLIRNTLLPIGRTYLVTPDVLRTSDSYSRIQFGKKGEVWLGLELNGEVECAQYVSFLIKGTDGVLPKRIIVGATLIDLNYTTAERFNEIPIMEPFDSQQMTPDNLNVISYWQNVLSKSDNGRLIYITDTTHDRDIFKGRAYPKAFQQTLESVDLDRFSDNTLWFLFDFGTDYDVPENIDIIPNVVPAVNVNVYSATLTQSSPIAKLSKNDGSFFLSVVETPLSLQKQGFNANEEEFVIRDFDSRGYNPDNLAKDVRNLYNHFIEDYHAFFDYNGLKDGELIKSLRETVNKIGKSVLTNQDHLNRFDEGVYAMRNIKLIGNTSPVKVSYMTTMGRKGNLPKEGAIMENKKDAALDKEVRVVVPAIGGEDRATADQMYELLRFYTLTADRLYTKMDIDAFLRLQLLREFGKEEVKRISYSITIEGASGTTKLQRGLYIDISFKDKKNYEKALSIALDHKLTQQIADRSCIAMPITISLQLTEL